MTLSWNRNWLGRIWLKMTRPIVVRRRSSRSASVSASHAWTMTSMTS